MIIVSNTSPVVNLYVIGQLEILKILFKEIIIPEAVYNEIVIYGYGKPGSKELGNIEWIKTRKVKDRNLVKALSNELDKGEAESIALAVESKADLLLLDEKIGRKVASRFSLNYIGLLGVIMMGKHKGVIHEVEPLLNKLTVEAGFWIAPDLYNYILTKAREVK